MYNQTPTLLITGDLSFFYDSNGLWNKYIRSDFRIILINNNGGGIFRILPGHQENSVFENYFETVHNRTAKELCSSHKIDYYTANDSESLTLLLSEFYKETGKPKLLEITTPRRINNKILLNYFDFITLELLLINKVKDTNKL